MFFIAKDASEGILGFSLIIFRAKSFIESIVAINFLSVESGLDSGISFIVAVKYGSSEIMSFSSNLFFP